MLYLLFLSHKEIVKNNSTRGLVVTIKIATQRTLSVVLALSEALALVMCLFMASNKAETQY